MHSNEKQTDEKSAIGSEIKRNEKLIISFFLSLALTHNEKKQTYKENPKAKADSI